MDDFQSRLDTIDIDGLSDLLLSRSTPFKESELLKFAFPGMQIFDTSALELYQAHFILFHALYKLQDMFFENGRYLHVHFSSTIIKDIPDNGLCRHFEDNLLKFCCQQTENSAPYCEFHRKLKGESSLEELSIKFFYLDISNFSKLDDSTAEAFISGTWELMSNYEDYKNSFKVLDLPETSDTGLIKRKFKQLAKLHHPDTDNGSREDFMKINSAYRLLMRLVPLFDGVKI